MECFDQIQEVEELIEGWIPEPLIPAKTPLMELDEKIPVISRYFRTLSIIRFYN
jgi:hypothetical protein